MSLSLYLYHYNVINGKKSLPWRVFIISDDDRTFVESNLVTLLSEKSKIKDPSWIKPGKVAWDWWNANNIYGVDFEAGINQETYKYYIDFASENNKIVLFYSQTKFLKFLNCKLRVFLNVLLFSTAKYLIQRRDVSVIYCFHVRCISHICNLIIILLYTYLFPVLHANFINTANYTANIKIYQLILLKINLIDTVNITCCFQ